MKQVSKVTRQYAEQGGAGVKLLIALVIFMLIGHAGYHYIPTAYNGQSFKQDMETAVIQGVTLPSTYGKPIDIVKGKLIKAAENNQVPYDVFIDVKQKGDVITARVYYKENVPILPFGIYDYEYVFDHTASPSGFLSK